MRNQKHQGSLQQINYKTHQDVTSQTLTRLDQPARATLTNYIQPQDQPIIPQYMIQPHTVYYPTNNLTKQMMQEDYQTPTPIQQPSVTQQMNLQNSSYPINQIYPMNATMQNNQMHNPTHTVHTPSIHNPSNSMGMNNLPPVYPSYPYMNQ